VDDETSFLRALFAAAVEAVSPARCVPPHLPAPPAGRTVVAGFGKAAAAMALVVEQCWPGPLSGVVVVPDGGGVPGLRQIRVIEAGHPVPDARSVRAAAEVLSAVRGLSPDDLVLALVSGGGSALLASPGPGVTLAEKQQVTRALLRSGAPIAEFNCVRKHISAIKGGRLALACAPARLVSLVISDVPGDDPATIAGGPTVADPTTTADALAVLARYGGAPPASVARLLASPAAETPKPGGPAFARTAATVVASGMNALEAAGALARARGYAVLDLGEIEGEAREAAAGQAALAARIARGEGPVAAPAVILSGGETTVTVRGQGRGGRNAEFLLALALALQDGPRVWAIACGTDGRDGTEDNAGAILTPDALARAARQGLDPAALLADNDSYAFFEALDALVVTGPTRTNVSDFRAILVGRPAGH